MMNIRDERDKQAAKLAASMPDEQATLLEVAADAVDNLHCAVLVDDAEGAAGAMAWYEAVIWKMNGGTFFGCNADSDSPGKVVERYCQADPGTVPKWGQKGAFVVVVDGMRVLVEFGFFGSQGGANFSFHAVDLDALFISETGYRSHFDGLRFGSTVEDAAKGILADYIKDKRHNIKDSDRDRLASSPLPAALASLRPPARRSKATIDIPPGYALVDVVLPAQKAFIVRKWAEEALVAIDVAKPAKELPIIDRQPKGNKAQNMHARKEIGRFELGQRCQIISVHHPVFEKDIGKFVIITKLFSNSSLVWAHDDAPVQYRINRNGQRVVQYDPRSVHSIYCVEQLRLAPVIDTDTGETNNE